MKTLIVVMLCSGLAYADQSANSFGQGFAEALQRALEARQQQEQRAQQEPSRHFDLIDNYGNPAGYEFATRSHCLSYLRRSELYKDCILVQE